MPDLIFAPRLSPRQLQVLVLSAEGYKTVEMAKAMSLGEQTVKTHIRKMLARWQVRNRAEAVAKGFRAGVLS